MTEGMQSVSPEQCGEEIHRPPYVDQDDGIGLCWFCRMGELARKEALEREGRAGQP